uniref:NADPH-dependent diflavin oxidoreductase 1 n=1 Tax=Ciona savignyi TaxID=51511 RepID=H2Z1M2_CIOSA
FDRLITSTEMERVRVVMLYGSQTGTAEEVTSNLVMQSRGSLFKCTACALDDYLVKDLVNEEMVVFVCSTTGQGEPPDNMKRFWKFIMRKNLPVTCLSGLKFGVLGLGDSSYAKYNFIAKKLFRRLQNLGGEILVPLGLADDQHEWGCDAVVDEWSRGLWQKLISIYPIKDGVRSAVVYSLDWPLVTVFKVTMNEMHMEAQKEQQQQAKPNHLEFSKKNPYLAALTGNQRVTATEHFQSLVLDIQNRDVIYSLYILFQDTRLISLDISAVVDKMRYEPGDVVMVQPRNLPHNVNALLGKTNDDDDSTTSLPKQATTLREIATNYLDFMSKEKLVELGQPEGTDERYSYANRPRRTILEVLQDFHLTASKISLERIFDIFPPIQPRAFSIASSPTRHRGKLQILVAVVRYKTRLQLPRQGVCSTWLASLQPNDRVPVWLKRGGIRFPAKQHCILIGPGTGIAPFRSAAHERTSNGNAGRCTTVFFGCRKSSSDFYFRDEWEDLDVDLHVACSRDQEDKIYVQHRIKEQGEKIWRLVSDENASVFVAGNSKSMPDDVKSTFLEIFRVHGAMTSQEADDYCRTMQSVKRYQQETWS